jgi:osmotically-inducible protein OsmY
MSEDSQLQQAVLAEISWEPSVTDGHIGVTANGGVVTLTGNVDSYAKKMAAERAAHRVKGVKAVAEEIEVRLAFDIKRPDEDIAEAAIDRLAWNVSIPKDSVEVKVEQGWVTLTGQVDWWYQKEAAERDIRPLRGVRGVSNQMTIKPRAMTESLSDDITHALHRLWFFGSEQVHVHAEAGKVVLTGTVHSLYERRIAAQIAWSAPGTSDLQNDLAVIFE